jgi:hypothetical protein
MFLLVGFWSTALAEPYALRSFKLGMMLIEFRAIPHPDQERYPGVRLYCTGDASLSELRSSDRFDLDVLGSEAKIGIKRCKYFRPMKLIVNEELFETGVIVANIGAYVTFEFLSDGEDPQIYYLFRIQIRSNTGYFDQFLSAFKQRFGEPHAARNEPVQNKFGGVFDNHAITWTNPESSIRMEQRWNRIDNMRIVYTHHRLLQELNKRIEVIEGKPSDKL